MRCLTARCPTSAGMNLSASGILPALRTIAK
jgi:hypothetical protein